MAWESSELIPDGVNVGGWFCLEDWFYSQATKATTGNPNQIGHLVATANLEYEAATFQLNRDTLVGHVGSIFSLSPKEKAELLRPYFGCESDLINLLLQSGFQESRILDLFWQHRQGYLCPIDFARIRSLGIRKIRLPLTWCINYDKPYRIKGKTFEGQDQEVIIGTHAALVNDPFENDPSFNPKGMRCPCDKWASIPINVVEHVLEAISGSRVSGDFKFHEFAKFNFIHKDSDYKNDKRWGRRRMMSRIKTYRNHLLSSYKDILGQMRCFSFPCLSKSDSN